MTSPIKLVIDCSTGETTEVELTAEEVAAQQVGQELAVQLQAELEVKAAARESALAKLAALGLTPEEVAAL
jgi:hypothetical protein